MPLTTEAAVYTHVRGLETVKLFERTVVLPGTLHLYSTMSVQPVGF